MELTNYTVENNIGERIDKYINLVSPELTRTLIQKYIEHNKITVNGNLIKPSYKVRLKDNIVIEKLEIEVADIVPENILLDVIYEDNDLLVINKAKGMVVHPGNGNNSGTLVNSLMYSHKDNLSDINAVIRPGIVHRIDKDTTGILVVAKNNNAHKILSEKFKVHDIQREYLALVKGIILKDKIDINLPIGRDPKNRQKMCVIAKNAKNANTTITVLNRFRKSNYTLVLAKLTTGRTHQIRVHMSYIGHSIVGDSVYGKAKNEFGVEGQLLHAQKLGFIHPTTQKYVEWTVDVPNEFQYILDLLNKREKEG